VDNTDPVNPVVSSTDTVYDDTALAGRVSQNELDIADTLDLDRPYTSRCMTHLRNLEIFKKYRHGVMINPEYFFAGSLEDKPKLHAIYNKLGKQEEEITNVEAY